MSEAGDAEARTEARTEVKTGARTGVKTEARTGVKTGARTRSTGPSTEGRNGVKTEAKTGGDADGGNKQPKQPVLPRLLILLRPERTRLITVGALTMLSVGLLVIGPWLLGRATDVVFEGVVGKELPAGQSKADAVAALRAAGHSHLADMLAGMAVRPGVGVDLHRLGQLLGLAIAAYLLSAAFGWAQARILTGVAQRTMYRLREATEEKLIRLPLRHFDTHPHGDILSRVVNDVDNVATTLQDTLNQLPSAALTVLTTLGIMFWISPVLATASLITIPVVMAVASVLAGKAKARFQTQWEQTGRLTSMVEESYTGHALILAYGRRDLVAEEFGAENQRLRRAGYAAQLLSGAVFPAVVLVGNLNSVVVAALGGYQVATGAVSLGAVQAFIQYSQRFTSPVIQSAGQMNVLQSGIVSAGRVFEFLDAEEEPELAGLAESPELPRLGESPELAGLAESPQLPRLGESPDGVAAQGSEERPDSRSGGHRVQLESVSFRYAPDTPLIEDFTLEAAPGQTVAIVGPTGAGKTTLVNLLVRFYEIDGGRILLDGVDYRDLSRDQVRRRFGMVLQDTWLFHGTIRDNIGYGREGADDEEIRAAARAAHVDDFVRTLPDGYDTVLEGEASNVSSGQKQLLTIARAFLADPGILILDEATSNVDTRTEAMIQQAMARLRSGRTSFVIAHRLSTIRAADTIVVMDAGRVVEQGGHEELLERRGFYYELYNSQFAETLVA